MAPSWPPLARTMVYNTAQNKFELGNFIIIIFFAKMNIIICKETMSINLPILFYIYLSACLSIQLTIHLSAHLPSIPLSIPFLDPPNHLSIHLQVYSTIHPSTMFSVNLQYCKFEIWAAILHKVYIGEIVMWFWPGLCKWQLYHLSGPAG